MHKCGRVTELNDLKKFLRHVHRRLIAVFFWRVRLVDRNELCSHRLFFLGRDAISAAAMPGGAAGTEGSPENDQDVVVICGTVFMMVDVREELGFDEPRVSAALLSGVTHSRVWGGLGNAVFHHCALLRELAFISGLRLCSFCRGFR